MFRQCLFYEVFTILPENDRLFAIMEESIDNHAPKQLQPYLWKKGQSGNPNGRPKGKTLKEFARQYLESLPEDQKIDYLASLPTDIVWKMAEGMPQTNSDLKVEGSLNINIINYENIDDSLPVQTEQTKG